MMEDFDMGMDFSFGESEDFGLAKSFSPAPPNMITPVVKHEEFTNMDRPDQFELKDDTIRADGFNFKLAPVED